jgi:hypothetical protein
VPENDFIEWRRHIISELERLARLGEDHNRWLIRHDVELALVKAKAALLGLAAGTVVTLIAQYLYHQMTK